MANNPISAAGNAVSSTVSAGGGLLSAAWKAVRTIAPILAVSTVIAAATGGLSIPLTAGAVSAAGTSVATTSAVHVTAANMASFTLQGLVHNFHGLADGVTWLANHIPAVG